MSNSKQIPYFYNAKTNESSWETPTELTEEQIKQLPGAQLLGQASQAKSSQGGGKPGEVRASHLLVKHNASRRPSSWKEVGLHLCFLERYPYRQQANITRSKDEAIAILHGYEKEIGGNPEKFKELAKQYSDCSSHSTGGDLGWFGPGQMQKPFEEGTFALDVGQISEIISTDSGVHLIMRTG